MTDFCLYSVIQFAEGLRETIRNEHWIVPKTSRSARARRDDAAAFARRGVNDCASLIRDRDGAYKRGAAPCVSGFCDIGKKRKNFVAERCIDPPISC